MSYHPIHDPEPHSSYPPTAAPRRTTMDPKRRMKLILAYTPDWCITIGLAGVFFALDKVPGFKREFSLQDTSIRHTFAVQERVPAWALYLIAIVAPLVLQPLINLISVRSWWDLHASTLGLILSLSLTGAITQFSKITVGRPRPDLIDRCQPIASAADAAVGLSTVHICTQIDQSILRDGWRSFPSGHSSLSFAGLGFLSFYLAGKVHLFDRRGHARKAWLAFAPLSGAALVAISRTMDYRHHWQDVLVGSLLGLSIAYFTYRQYYPSLASPQCEKPHSPPYKEDGESLLPIHQRPPSPRNIPLRDDRDTGYVDRYSHDGSLNEHEDIQLNTVVPKPERAEALDHIWPERETIGRITAPA